MKKMSLHCHIPLVNATAHARKESCNPYIEHLSDSCAQCRSMSSFSFLKCYFHTYAKGQKMFSLYSDKGFFQVFILLFCPICCTCIIYINSNRNSP